MKIWKSLTGKTVLAVITVILAVIMISCTFTPVIGDYGIDGNYIPMRSGKLLLKEEIEPPEDVEEPFHIEYNSVKGLSERKYLIKHTLENMFDNNKYELLIASSASDNPIIDWKANRLFTYESLTCRGDESELYIFNGIREFDASVAESVKSDITEAGDEYLDLNGLLSISPSSEKLPNEFTKLGIGFSKSDSIIWTAVAVYYDGYYYKMWRGAEIKYIPMSDAVSSALADACSFNP